jgi:hypothetical protein
MTENSEEEQIEEPTSSHSENNSSEIQSKQNSDEINSNQEIENMEVHHHAHDPAEPHHKKNWKSYFWEFLMLFFAVFCGFLAEYELEHKIEKDRSEQYIYSFYEDLKIDSTHFRKIMDNYQLKISVLENLSLCYDSLIKNQSSTNCLCTIMSNSNSFIDMTYTDRTLTQLKNAGGLRLLNKEDADKIILYDNLLRNYKTAETTGFQKRQDDLRETATSLRDYEKWKDTTNSPRIFAIYGNDKVLLNKYFNQLTMYLNNCNARVNDLQKIKEKNTKLIEYLKAKYDYN